MKFKQKWWNMNSDPHKGIGEEINRLEKEWNSHKNSILTSYRHYSNKYYSAALKGQYMSQSVNNKTTQTQNPIVINLIRNIVDTVVGKITKSNQKLVTLPKRNDPIAERTSKAVEKFIHGQFQNLNIHQATKDTFRHAAITGSGFVKMYFDPFEGPSGEIKIEKVLPTEIFFPPELSYYGDSPIVYQTRLVEKYNLAGMFPEHKDAILAAAATPKAVRTTAQENPEIIQVVEAWHVSNHALPEGRHVICIDGTTLIDEPYQYDFLPIISLHYNNPPVGAYGIGIAHMVRAIQLEVNMIATHISENMRLMGRPKWFVPKGCQIAPNMFTNRIEIIEYNNQAGAPQMSVANPTPPELFNQMDRLIQLAYNIVGVSQMSATSQKDSALTSGVAIQAAQDIESERFIELQQSYESFLKEIGKRILILAKDNYKPEDNRIIKTLDKNSFEEISFNDLDLDDKDYILDIQVASSLPDTKAGKMQFVLDMASIGIIQDPQVMLELLEFPGQEKVFETMLGDVHLADEYIIRLSDPEEAYVAPDPYENHQVIYKKVSAYYKSRRFYNMDPIVKDKFVRHMNDRLILMTPPEPVMPEQTPQQTNPQQNVLGAAGPQQPTGRMGAIG